jgi:small conductance mechanosensitive channel
MFGTYFGTPFSQAVFGMHIGSTAARVLLTIGIAFITQVLIHDSLDRMVRRVVRSHKYESKAEERKREDTLVSFFRTLSTATIWTVAIIIVLSEFHVHLSALLTGAGLIGIVIGFGMQNLLRDYFAGITIIMENQFRVGDYVNMSGGPNIEGIVEDLSIRTTRVRDINGGLHIVPNGSAGIITNMTYRFSNANVVIKLAYGTDVDKAEQTINGVGSKMAKESAWAEKIVDPIKFLRVDDFKDGAITVTAIGKVRPGAQWDTASSFRRRLIAEFKKQHIEMK